MTKIVGIFCGGFSSEFEISLKSATTISTNFPKNYNSYLIVVNKEEWYAEKNGQKFEFNRKDLTIKLGKTYLKIDVGLVYIHGEPGENGKIQALLDLHDIPYLNSGVLASALSFDKWYCNQFLKSFGIDVAKSIRLTKNQVFHSEHIKDELGLPLFVKPCDSGSSYGISKVKEVKDLASAISNAFKEGDSLVIESFLDGTEVTCGVYRNSKGLKALPLTEIVSENDFFDYDAKYNGKSQEITPARISSEAREKIQQSAMEIYQLLQLKSIARIDFMLVEGKPYVIEVNTTPGFSSASIVPKMLSAAGISIADFWQEVLDAELQ
jgi:D-alanine-D-alanine ligase